MYGQTRTPPSRSFFAPLYEFLLCGQEVGIVDIEGDLVPVVDVVGDRHAEPLPQLDGRGIPVILRIAVGYRRQLHRPHIALTRRIGNVVCDPERDLLEAVGRIVAAVFADLRQPFCVGVHEIAVDERRVVPVARKRLPADTAVQREGIGRQSRADGGEEHLHPAAPAARFHAEGFQRRIRIVRAEIQAAAIADKGVELHGQLVIRIGEAIVEVHVLRVVQHASAACRCQQIKRARDLRRGAVKLGGRPFLAVVDDVDVPRDARVVRRTDDGDGDVRVVRILRCGKMQTDGIAVPAGAHALPAGKRGELQRLAAGQRFEQQLEDRGFGKCKAAEHAAGKGCAVLLHVNGKRISGFFNGKHKYTSGSFFSSITDFSPLVKILVVDISP